jgi:hypothetical protein
MTHMTNTTDRDPVADELDVLDLEPTDSDWPIPAEWLKRYERYCTIDGGYLVVSRPDPEAELNLYVLTANGVIRSEARFDVTATGLRMFHAAVMAILAL